MFPKTNPARQESIIFATHHDMFADSKVVDDYQIIK